MSPLEIKILLHYHTIPKDYSQEHEMYSAQNEAIIKLFNKGMLKNYNGDGVQYEATAKLHSYCEYLCEVPLPIAVWVIPEDKS